MSAVREIFPIAVAGAITVWMAVSVAEGLISGVISAGTPKYYRRKQPALYWRTVVARLGFGVLGAVYAVRHILERWT